MSNSAGILNTVEEVASHFAEVTCFTVNFRGSAGWPTQVAQFVRGSANSRWPDPLFTGPGRAGVARLREVVPSQAALPHYLRHLGEPGTPARER